MRIFTTVCFLFFILCSAQAQVETRLVKGTLTDPDSGDPMPGVNVVIKGTTTGTVTDMNGNYQLEAPIGSVLVFSFVGYTTKEVLVRAADGVKSDTSKIKQKVFRHTIPDNPEKTLSPYFFVKSDNPSVDQMPLKSTSASVNIAGVIADVKVKQVYINTGKNTLEAVYIFPGSTRAAVYGMSMTIGNRKLIAKIREKEQARQDYEQAKVEGKTATLLEQKRPNVFQMNVANILPGDTIAVELNYTELLIPVNGTYQFVYPTVVGPRYSETADDQEHADENWVQNPYQQEGILPSYAFDFKTTLNTGIPIQRVTSTSHKVSIDFQAKNSAVIELDKTETFGGNRDFILQYRLRGGAVESGLLLYPRGDENFFLLMMEPPDAPRLDQIPSREYIFVVDVSGSMQGFPLQVSKRLLRNLISSLRPTDRFNVMLFESSNSMLHPKSVAATEENIDDAIRVLDQQTGGGGTRLYPALQTALKYEKLEGTSRTFIVVTDGYVTVEKEAFNLVRQNLNAANLFAFGIGSSVNRHLIEGLAHAGMGEPFIVTNESEAQVIGKKFISLVENPVLTNIAVDYGSFDVYDVEPMSIPDVFVERPIIIFGKYRGEAKGSIRLSGMSGGESYAKTIDLKSATQENNQALRYLWARNKIKYLDDFAGYYEDDGYGSYGAKSATSNRTEQVTALGLKYNLLTQYTSFIAIDSLVRNPSKNSQKVNQPLPLPQGVSNGAVAIRGLSLLPDVQSLSEVVVCGYGVQEKRDVTASITTVSSTDVFQNSTNVNGALQGRVAGVVVNQNSGEPGSNTTVRIRGSASMASSNTPLYIIDGVPMDNTDHPAGTAGVSTPDKLTDINPNDIESIEVLKSASTAAIYGSRASNGVIVITTKKPKTGSRDMSITTSFSIEEANKLPELQDQFAQGRPVGGALQWQGADTNEVFSWGPRLNTLMYDGSQYDYDKHGRLVPLANGEKAASPYNRYDLFRKGFTADNYFRIGHATEKMKYSATVGNTAQQGIIPGSSLNRTTLNLSGEKIVVRNLTLGAAALLSHTTTNLVQRGNSTSSILYGLLTTPASFDNGNGQGGKKAFRNSDAYELEDNSPRSFSAGLIDNPYWSAHKNTYEGSVDRIIPKVFADYRILDGLSVRYTLSGDLYKDKQLSGIDLQSAAAPEGRFTNREETYQSLNSELLIKGTKRFFNNDLRFDATVGLNNFFAERGIDRTDGAMLLEAGNFDPDNAVQRVDYSKVYKQQNGRVLSSLHIKYQEYLSLNLASSWERTSTLSKDNNNLNSMGAGVAFNFTELPGVDLYNVLSSGKIFTSVGRIQREAPMFIDPNYYFAATADVTSPVLNPERIESSRPANLRTEQVASWEVGTTLGALQGRVEVTAAWFSSNTSDLFVPLISGTSFSIINGGSLSNKGGEINLKGTPVQNNFKWDVSLNLTKYKSMVTELPGTDRIALAGFTSMSSNLIAGQPYGVFYGSRYLRNDKGEKVIGADGFPMLDPVMGVIGDPNPDWTMGIENTLSYENFDLDFLIDIRKGGDVWNGTRNTLDYYGTSMKTGEQREIKGYVFQGVTETGESNTIPVDFVDPTKPVTENRWTRYGIGGVAEDGIEDGSWVRLRSLSMSYRLTQAAASRLGLKNVSISFVGRNLILLTRYSGIDPETNLTGNSNGRGLDYFNLPNTRSYGVVLKLGI